MIKSKFVKFQPDYISKICTKLTGGSAHRIQLYVSWVQNDVNREKCEKTENRENRENCEKS